MSGPHYFSTQGHLLVCQGQSCQSRGSALLYRALWNALERDSLAYYKKGGSVRLTESGCLGACSYGPTLCAYRKQPDGTLAEGWYAATDLPQALSVARAVHTGQPLPPEGRYGPERP